MHEAEQVDENGSIEPEPKWIIEFCEEEKVARCAAK